MISLLSSAYGAAAKWRRRQYSRDPARVRRLDRPVISVGSLRVGGSGKTPVVEYLARLLVDHGERPAILTRGYARRMASDGVTIVSDGDRVRASVHEAGDEPLMLAHALRGVRVLVSANRYLSGRLAERQLDATVHLLDDGFQHLGLARDLDLLLAAEEDLSDRPLPAGRLRESLDAAATADAVLVTAGYDTAAQRVARALRVPTVFRVARSIGAPRMITGNRDSVVVPAGSRVFVVCGIAQPERFTADIVAAGWDIAGMRTYRDHHPFTDREVERIRDAARTAGSAIVLTTEKDAVRLSACNLGDLPIASVPLAISIQPADHVREWLMERLAVRKNRR
jgi:tetraacyldisaccharide 4'-kinase